MSIAHFAVLRHQPYPQRTEHVNIGVVVFLEDGSVRVSMAGNLRKLRAFDPSADIETARSQEEHLAVLFQQAGKDCAHEVARLLGPWRLGREFGMFAYDNEQQVGDGIAWALQEECEPSTPVRQIDRPQISRLFVDLKRTFDMHGWLGKTADQISEHFIVPRFPISLDEGLFADFALQNGVLHVIETLDFRQTSNHAAKRTEGQAKALVLAAATDAQANSETYAIVAGSAADHAKTSIRLLERLSSHLYAYESTSDMNALFDRLGVATGRPMLQVPVR